MTDGDWTFQFDNWDSKSAHAKEQRSFNDDVILYLMPIFPRQFVHCNNYSERSMALWQTCVCHVLGSSAHHSGYA